MLQKVYCGFVIVLLWAVICSAANEEQQSNSSNSTPGLRSIFRIYDECQRSDGGVSMCLKKKAVTFIDRIAKIDVINIGEGVRVVGVDNAAAKTARSLSENELDQMLPRSMEDRDYFLNNMLTDKLASYISGRKIQINLPQVTPNELGRGLEEGEPISLIIWIKNLFQLFNRKLRRMKFNGADWTDRTKNAIHLIAMDKFKNDRTLFASAATLLFFFRFEI